MAPPGEMHELAAANRRDTRPVHILHPPRRTYWRSLPGKGPRLHAGELAGLGGDHSQPRWPTFQQPATTPPHVPIARVHTFARYGA